MGLLDSDVDTKFVVLGTFGAANSATASGPSLWVQAMTCSLPEEIKLDKAAMLMTADADKPNGDLDKPREILRRMYQAYIPAGLLVVIERDGGKYVTAQALQTIADRESSHGCWGEAVQAWVTPPVVVENSQAENETIKGSASRIGETHTDLIDPIIDRACELCIQKRFEGMKDFARLVMYEMLHIASTSDDAETANAIVDYNEDGFWIEYRQKSDAGKSVKLTVDRLHDRLRNPKRYGNTKNLKAAADAARSGERANVLGLHPSRI